MKNANGKITNDYVLMNFNVETAFYVWRREEGSCSIILRDHTTGQEMQIENPTQKVLESYEKRTATF
jgi:hypothetical protein